MGIVKDKALGTRLFIMVKCEKGKQRSHIKKPSMHGVSENKTQKKSRVIPHEIPDKPLETVGTDIHTLNNSSSFVL